MSAESTSPPPDGDATVEQLASAPVLGALAAAAALLELLASRLVWLTLGAGDRVEESVVTLRRIGVLELPRSLAAVAGIVAVIVGVVSFIRLPGYAPLARRLIVAAVAGMLMPAFFIATFLPAPFVRGQLVLMALVTTQFLVTMFALTAARYAAGRATTIGVALLASTATLTTLDVALRRLVEGPTAGVLGALAGFARADGAGAGHVAGILLGLAELTWLGMIVALAVAALRGRGGRAASQRLGAGLAVSAVLLGVGMFAAGQLGNAFGAVLYGSFRLGALLGPQTTLYLLPLGLALAAGLVAQSRPDRPGRQLGQGLLLLVLAGQGPHTPFQLLYLLLGAILVTRAAQAMDPLGAWRDLRPWTRSSGEDAPEPETTPEAL